MSDLPKYLQRLDEALFDLPDDTEAMLLSEVDGYLTGLALMPVEVPEAEWLPAIWRPNPDTPDYLYHDRALLGEIETLATQHRRMVARDLHAGDFAPILDVGERDDDVFWEPWMDGFARAMEMRPEAFAAIADAPEQVREAFDGLLALAMIAGRQPEDEVPSAEAAGSPAAANDSGRPAPIPDEQLRALKNDAPDLIQLWIGDLYDWSRPLRPTPDFAVPVRSEKVGRNDPCPCGSGKKYKKCCGAND